MAGRRDIEAGRAFVSLALNDSAFVKGLRKNGERLKTFGTSLAGIGAGITAAGAAILAPLAAMQHGFLEAGDALDKMRQRTGISVEALSELGHAAGQSGTDLATLETGVAKMQKQITLGGKAFEHLGLSLEALQAMNPEQQFDAVAKAIGRIEDPTERAARAMEIFGKSGTQLLPMIEDLEALRQEARDLGFVMSGEAAAASVKLGDLLANLWKTVTFAGHALSEALAPPMIEGVKIMQRFGTGILKWIQQNKQLVVTIAAAGAAIVGLGLIITGLGLSFALLGVAMKGLAAGIGVVGSVLGVLLTPLGLIAASLTAGAVLWAIYTQSGQAAMAKLGEVFGDLLTTAKMTFGGISDALVAGDLALAGSIAMAGLNVALLTGLDAISEAIGGGFGDFLGTLGSQILDGDLSAAWETATIAMGSMWDAFAEGITAAFTTAVRTITGLWEGMTKKISNWLLENASKGGIFGKLALAGTGSAGALDPEKAEKQRQQQIAATTKLLESQKQEMLDAMVAGASDDDIKEYSQAIDGLKQRLAELQGETADPLADAQAIAGAQITGTADRIRGAMNGADASAQAQSDASRRQRENRTRGGANPALSDAQSELEVLRAQAAKARADAEKEASKRREQTASEDAEPDMASKVFGTFSAAALQASGQNNPALTEQKKTNKELSDLNKTQQDALDFIKATGAWT